MSLEVKLIKQALTVMKIDLHCHTKNVKQGDVSRDVDASTFASSIINAGVGMLAITNHNAFDKDQYDAFVNSIGGKSLILPGIELDVSSSLRKEKTYGHVILITDPRESETISSLALSYCSGKPDDVCLDITELIAFANKLSSCIVSCHYRKNPHLDLEDIQYIKANINDDSVVVLEPSNSRKAGIIINSDGENCWYGSDVENWNNYPGKPLPDCLFQISSFQSFIDLLKKNQSSVLLKTFLSVKGPEKIHIEPFEDLSLDLPLYRDTNIVFGGKATGKTIILQKIEEALKNQGKSVKSFFIEGKLDAILNTADYRPSSTDLSALSAKNSESDFKAIKEWNWSSIPSLSDFYEAEVTAENNKLLNHLKITEASFSETINNNFLKTEKVVLSNDLLKISEIKEIKNIDVLSKEEKTSLFNCLDVLYRKLIENFLSNYFINEAKKLSFFTIQFISKGIATEQGTKAKPASCGLTTTFGDYRFAKRCLESIQSNLNYGETIPDVLVGTLPVKGCVYRRTYLGFAPQEQSKKKDWLKRHFLDKDTKVEDYRQLLSNVKTAIKKENSIDLVGQIEELKSFFSNNGLSSLEHFKNYSNLLVNGEDCDFKPSNGEISILLVDSAVSDQNSDAIILDEPDSGMGSDFINGDLLQKIRDRAINNKIIVISTHDPNLVVRTHPYLCVFREEKSPGVYNTFIGSSFEDSMENPKNPSDKRWWIDECINKCEGGRQALNERERTYGKYNRNSND